MHEFVDRLVHHAGQVRVGNGLDQVDMGPLASKRELARYPRMLDGAHAEGAAVPPAAAGRRIDKGLVRRADGSRRCARRMPPS